MENKKKLSLIVKSEEWYGISLFVNKDFDEEHNSPVIKKLLSDFPKSKRKRIFPQRDEVEMMNEGEMKNEPQFYLNKSGELENLNKI